MNEEMLEFKEHFDFEENNKKFDKKFQKKDYLWSQKLRMLCDNKTEEDFVFLFRLFYDFPVNCCVQDINISMKTL